MSMRPQEISPVPEETARIARAAYPRGNVYMQLRDELGTIYQDHREGARARSPSGRIRAADNGHAEP